MQSGQVFTVDAQAVKELASFYKRPEADFAKLEGGAFSVANSKATAAVTDSEVRATKWEDGKPKRGRPRKFPRATVARLLGEEDDLSLTTPAPQAEEASDELDSAADELIAASTPVQVESEESEGDTW